MRTVNGRGMPIRSVFTFALKYFKDSAIQQYPKEFSTDVSGSNFEWVITVPAIWQEGAKQAMREAAHEANKISTQF